MSRSRQVCRTAHGKVQGFEACFVLFFTLGVCLKRFALALKVGGSQGPESCEGTVSYVFIATEHLPLENVWRAYFDGCPRDSYTIHVHSQDTRPLTVLEEANVIPDPVRGSPRFKYTMQEIMLRLYREASNSITRSGCKPQWVQLLSESCAPVRRCIEHHDLLKTYAGTSLIGDGSHNLFETPPGKSRKPRTWRGKVFLKQTQWNTLWMEHVDFLLKNEKENEVVWSKTWCPDEHYTINVLTEAGFNITRRTLTNVLNTQDLIADVISGGHPELVKCPSLSELNKMHSKMHALELVHMGNSAGARLVSICQDAECVRSHLRPFQEIADQAIMDGASFVRKFEAACADMLWSFQLQRTSAATFTVDGRTVDVLLDMAGGGTPAHNGPHLIGRSSDFTLRAATLL